MRRLMIPALVVSTILAAPAAAQSFGNRGDNRFDRQIDQLVDRIRGAENRDVISPREEDRLLRQARHLNDLERRYSRGGFTRWEAQQLERGIRDLRSQFRWERADGRRYSFNR